MVIKSGSAGARCLIILSSIFCVTFSYSTAFAAEHSGYEWDWWTDVPPCFEARAEAVDIARKICLGTQHSGVRINSCKITSFSTAGPGGYCVVSCDYDCVGELGSTQDNGDLQEMKDKHLN